MTHELQVTSGTQYAPRAHLAEVPEGEENARRVRFDAGDTFVVTDDAREQYDALVESGRLLDLDEQDEAEDDTDEQAESGDESGSSDETTEDTDDAEDEQDDDESGQDEAESDSDESEDEEPTPEFTEDEVDDADYRTLQGWAGEFDDVNGNWGAERLRAELRAKAQG